jgi:hypothetical protein
LLGAVTRLRRLALALLVAATVTTFALDASIAGEPPSLAERIKRATALAARALAARAKDAKLLDEGAPKGGVGAADIHCGPFQDRTLVALALLRAGGAAERATARAILDRWWADAAAGKLGITGNYELALAVSALEGTGLERTDELRPNLAAVYVAKPLAPDVQEKLGNATSALLAGHTTTHDGKGWAWSYFAAPLASGSGRTRDGAPGVPIVAGVYDNSNTQFAVLALHDASRAGIAIPTSATDAIAAHFLDCASEPPGKADEPSTGRTRSAPLRPLDWPYNTATPGLLPWRNMTLAGLSSLAIARHLGARGLDVPIRRGLLSVPDVLKGAPPVTKEGRGGYFYYSLEKALDLLEVERLEGEPWFPPLATKILDAQTPSGLWEVDPAGWDTDPLVETAFYILFLTRATVPDSRVVSRRPTGPGVGGPEVFPGEVWIARTRATVDAEALVRAYLEAQSPLAAEGLKAAREAVDALLADGQGRESCLFTLSGSLAASDDRSKREQGERWARELAGTKAKPEELLEWGVRFERLLAARRAHDPDTLRSALAEEKLAPPLVAYAASSLQAIAPGTAGPLVADALGRLAADEKILATDAGSRSARALAFVLSGALGRKLPELPARGVTAENVRRLLAEAR